MKTEIGIVVAAIALLTGCSTPEQATGKPDKAMLQQLHKGMLLWKFEQVVGKSARLRPNPTPNHSVCDYDFDGWCIIANVDASPVAPAATVRDYAVVEDGLTVNQREAERSKNWSAWVHAHRTGTNGVPNQASQAIGAPGAPQPER
jgi:hypothetical protein